ncbi:MAG: YiiD C-terminal domain-containing protein [Pontiella sp.]
MSARLFADMAPAQALGITVADYSNGRIVLAAPLKLNLNDKGTAFAGSISSMLLLAGWSAITLRLQEVGIKADVMVVKSETEFTAAARSALFAEAIISEAEMVPVIQSMEECGRSRTCVKALLHSANETCARSTAHYAVVG